MPEIALVSAWWRPNAVSSAEEISPTVARTRAASTASASRFSLPPPAVRVIAASACCTASGSRSRRNFASFSIWSLRTAALSTLSSSTAASCSGR
jgi:hypothetical protein